MRRSNFKPALLYSASHLHHAREKSGLKKAVAMTQMKFFSQRHLLHNVGSNFNGKFAHTGAPEFLYNPIASPRNVEFSLVRSSIAQQAVYEVRSGHGSMFGPDQREIHVGRRRWWGETGSSVGIVKPKRIGQRVNFVGISTSRLEIGPGCNEQLSVAGLCGLWSNVTCS